MGRTRGDARRWRWLVIGLAFAFSACGFHLRGAKPSPFETLYLNASMTSGIGPVLRRAVEAGGTTRVVDNPEDAKARLDVLNEAREKSILSLNAAGQVREFQIRYRIAFSVHDGKGKVFIAPSQITLNRDITFNDSQILAKETEESMLYRDMQDDAVQQILRRLAAVRVSE